MSTIVKYSATNLQEFIELGKISIGADEKSFNSAFSDIIADPASINIAQAVNNTQRVWMQTNPYSESNAAEWRMHFDAQYRSFKILNLKWKEDQQKQDPRLSFLNVFKFSPSWQKDAQQLFCGCFNIYLDTVKSPLLQRYPQLIELTESNPSLKKLWNAYKTAVVFENSNQSDCWNAFFVAACPKNIDVVSFVSYFKSEISFRDILEKQHMSAQLTRFGARLSARYAEIEDITQKDMATRELWSSVQTAYLCGNETAAEDKLKQLFNLLKGSQATKNLANRLSNFMFNTAARPGELADEFEDNVETLSSYETVLKKLSKNIDDKGKKKTVFEVMRNNATPQLNADPLIDDATDMSHVVIENKNYLASSAPNNENSAFKYFKTLIAQNTHVIVDLKEDQEKKVLGFKLFPEEAGDTKEYSEGDKKIAVKLVSKAHTQIPDTVLSIQFMTRLVVEVEMDGKKQEFVVHKLRLWTDQEAPDIIALRTFEKSVRNDFAQYGSKIAVNCVAGVGRTGTFLLYHHLAGEIAKRKTFNIFTSFFDLGHCRTLLSREVQLAAVCGALAEEWNENKVKSSGCGFNKNLYCHPEVRVASQGHLQVIAHSVLKNNPDARVFLGYLHTDEAFRNSIADPEKYKDVKLTPDRIAIGVLFTVFSVMFKSMDKDSCLFFARQIAYMNKELPKFLCYLFKNNMRLDEYFTQAEKADKDGMTPFQHLVTGDAAYFEKLFPGYQKHDIFIDYLKPANNQAAVRKALDIALALKKASNNTLSDDVVAWVKEFLVEWNKSMARDSRELDFLTPEDWKLLPGDLIKVLPVNNPTTLQSLQPQQVRQLTNTELSEEGWKALLDKGRAVYVDPSLCGKIPVVCSDLVDLEKLSIDQLKNIHPALLRTKKLKDLFSRLSESKVHAFSKEQLAVFFEGEAVEIAATDMWMLSPEQVKALTNKQLRKFDDAQLSNLREGQLKVLSGKFIASLSDTKQKIFINPSAVSNLNPHVFAEAPQLLSKLNEKALGEFVEKLKPEEVWILRRDPTVFQGLLEDPSLLNILRTKLKVKAETHAEIMAKNDHEFNRLSPADFLFFEGKTIEAITLKRLEKLSKKQITVILRELTPVQIQALDKSKHLSDLSAEALTIQCGKILTWKIAKEQMDEETLKLCEKQKEIRTAFGISEGIQRSMRKSTHFEVQKVANGKYVSGEILGVPLTAKDTPTMALIPVDKTGTFLMLHNAEKEKIQELARTLNSFAEEAKPNAKSTLAKMGIDPVKDLDILKSGIELNVLNAGNDPQCAAKYEINKKKYFFHVNNEGSIYTKNAAGVMVRKEAKTSALEEMTEDLAVLIFPPLAERIFSRASDQQKESILKAAFAGELEDACDELLCIAREQKVFANLEELLKGRLGLGLIAEDSPHLTLQF